MSSDVIFGRLIDGVCVRNYSRRIESGGLESEDPQMLVKIEHF